MNHATEQTMSQDTLTLRGRRFDESRFKRYLRLYCTTERTSIVSYYVIMVMGMLLCQIIWPSLTRFKDFTQFGYDKYCTVGIALSCIFGCIMMLEAGRRMYNRMGSRDIKNTLMVPASQLEKSAVWFIIWILGSIVTGTLSFIIFDSLRAAICLALAPEGSLVQTVWQQDISAENVLILATAFIGQQATFVLGGAVWYRNMWVKMIGFVTVMQWSIACIIATIVITFLSHDAVYYNNSTLIADGDITPEKVITRTVVALSWIVIVLCYILAYYRNRQNGLNFRW